LQGLVENSFQESSLPEKTPERKTFVIGNASEEEMKTTITCIHFRIKMTTLIALCKYRESLLLT
jgi:hypothetical protein